MRMGKELHEQILNETVETLREGGFKAIKTDGRIPTAVATKDKELIAISILAKKRHKDKYRNGQTITFLEDRYKMFDKVKRITFNPRKKTRKEVIEKTKNDFSEQGYNIIFTNRKCPDAIAIQDNKIFAVEVIGRKKGYSLERKKQNKKDVYYMFDDIIFNIFYYEGGKNEFRGIKYRG